MTGWQLIHCVDAPTLAAHTEARAAAHAAHPRYARMYADMARKIREDGSFERVKATFSAEEGLERAERLAARMNDGAAPGISYRVQEVAR